MLSRSIWASPGSGVVATGLTGAGEVFDSAMMAAYHTRHGLSMSNVLDKVW